MPASAVLVINNKNTRGDRPYNRPGHVIVEGEGIMAKDLDGKSVALHAKYRKEAKKWADKDGYKYFMFMGAVDIRTCPECEKHIGVVYTEEELLKISPDVFKYGFCKKCRCSLSPQMNRVSELTTRYRETVNKQRSGLADFRQQK